MFQNVSSMRSRICFSLSLPSFLPFLPSFLPSSFLPSFLPFSFFLSSFLFLSSLPYSKYLEQSLAHSRCSLSICRMN